MNARNPDKNSPIILSLGGSLVVPDAIDEKYLRRIAAFIKQQSRARRFIVVVGGGRTARIYAQAARRLGVRGHADLDWIGIHATRLNAALMKGLFGNLAETKIVFDPTKKVPFSRRILFGAGFKSGWSTDFVAVSLARTYGVRRVINLTNISHVYDRDPKKFKDAKPIREISWKAFRKIVGNRWVPGANKPFDPIASKLAQQAGIEVDILNGRDIANLSLAIKGRGFKGTCIR